MEGVGGGGGGVVYGRTARRGIRSGQAGKEEKVGKRGEMNRLCNGKKVKPNAIHPKD